MVAPSILSADFARMGDECAGVLDAGADLLHLDVMDGHFVPNLTMGPDMCKGIRRMFPDVFLDVHLMVTDPLRFARPFADAGANHLTMHTETVASQDVQDAAETVHGLGMSVGVAINPDTPTSVLEPWLGCVDLVLVMSVYPGRSGQAFIAETLDSTRWVHKRAESGETKALLQMDGGIGPETVDQCLDSGCNVVVAASAIFGQPTYARSSVIRRLRGKS